MTTFPTSHPLASLASALSPEESRRYGRHLSMPEIGAEGQARLKASAVLIVGAGGLGSPAALYLAAAGIGRIGLVDFDTVEETNLQRQILHTTPSVGAPKLESAVDRLKALNPYVDVRPHAFKLDRENALGLLRDYDVIIDATDNFATRYLINDACAMLGKADVYGSVFRFEGQVSVFFAEKGPCYRCLHPEPPPPHLAPDCAEAGVLGVLPGIIGTMQAAEAIKLLLNVGTPLIGTLLQIDALHWEILPLGVLKNPECRLCGAEPSIHELIDFEQWCAGAGRTESETDEITVQELAGKLRSRHPVQLIDVREPFESAIATIGGTLVPLDLLPEQVSRFDPLQETIVYCHTGRRSAHAVAYLRKLGFSKAKNLRGGIEAWSREIDRSVPRY